MDEAEIDEKLTRSEEMANWLLNESNLAKEKARKAVPGTPEAEEAVRHLLEIRRMCMSEVTDMIKMIKQLSE